MSEERRFLSSVWSSERMPIETLSKSMSRAAFGAWWVVPNVAEDIACGPRWIGAIACGPRCTGATCLCALVCADRCGRVLIFFGNYLWQAACLRVFVRDGCTPYPHCDECLRRRVFMSMISRHYSVIR